MYTLVCFYACSDLKKTAAFYQSLGLKLAQKEEGCYIYDCGQGCLGFLEKADFLLPNYSCISFTLKSMVEVDKKYQQLQNLYNCTKPAYHPNYPVYSFFLKDPDGYQVEFQYLTQGFLTK